MKFAKNEKGEVVTTEEEIQKTIDEAAQTAVNGLLSKLAPVPPVAPASAPDAEIKNLANAPVNEDRHSRQKRVNVAAAHISGGRLAIEDAPKEIKTIRYFRALADGEKSIVTALGRNSWEKTLTEGSAADGGNLVPVEFATDLKVAMETYGAVADCTQHNMTSNELDLRSVTTKPIIYQVNETIAVTQAGTKFGKPVLSAKAFAGLQVMSKELFQDNNVGLYDKLVALFAEGFAARKSLEIFVGSSFTGIAGSATPVTTTLQSSSIADIDYKSMVNCANSLSEGQKGTNAKWYMHRTTFGYIQGMVDSNGHPIVTNPWDAASRTLLGYPVVLDEQITSADAANTAFVFFGNLQWVDHGQRAGITSQVMTEGTAAGVNLGEQRSLGLVIDTRWGIVVSLPGNLAMIKTKA